MIMMKIYIKIKFYSHDNLSLNKTIKIPIMITVVFHENHYSQALLDSTKCKKQMSLFINDSMSLSDIAYLNIKNAGHYVLSVELAKMRP